LLLIVTSLRFRSRMGILQYRYICLHKVCWCTQIYGSTHFKSEALKVR